MCEKRNGAGDGAKRKAHRDRHSATALCTRLTRSSCVQWVALGDRRVRPDTTKLQRDRHRSFEPVPEAEPRARARRDHPLCVRQTTKNDKNTSRSSQMSRAVMRTSQYAYEGHRGVRAQRFLNRNGHAQNRESPSKSGDAVRRMTSRYCTPLKYSFFCFHNVSQRFNRARIEKKVA